MFSSRCKHGKVEFISKSSQSHCEMFFFYISKVVWPVLHRKCFQFRLLPNWLVGSFSVIFSVEFPARIVCFSFYRVK
jgi:hypothetical protein